MCVVILYTHNCCFEKKTVISFESETPTCRFVEARSTLFFRIYRCIKRKHCFLLPRPLRRPDVGLGGDSGDLPWTVHVHLPFPTKEKTHNLKGPWKLPRPDLKAALCRRPSFNGDACFVSFALATWTCL